MPLTPAEISTYWSSRERDIAWAPGSGNPSQYSYPVGFDIHIPYYDEPTGTFRMLMRFPPGGFGCPLHRHVAVTETFVLRGQQLVHRAANAARWETIRAAPPEVRDVGAYDRSGGPDELPHLEHGGQPGGIVLLAMQGDPDQAFLLFEYFRDDLSLKPAVGRKRLTVRNVVEGTRSYLADAVCDKGSDDVYALVCEQFGRRSP